MRVFRSLPLALLVVCTAAHSQEIVDHRDALLAVSTGSVQIETNLDHTWDQPDQTDVGALLRWGIGRGWEVQAGVPSYSRTFSETGLGDPTVGVKGELGTLSNWGAAATASVSLPLGGSLGGSGVETAATLVVGRDLAASFAVEVVGEVSYDSSARTGAGGAALVVSRPVVGPLEASFEVVTTIEDFDLASVLLQNGYTVLLGPTVQAVGYVAFGIEGSSVPDAIVGLGVSVRL